MKRTLLSLVVGVGVCAATSSAFGQAQIVFDHEGPVTYALTDVPAGKAGQFVEQDFGLALYFGAGIGYTSLGQLTLTPAALSWVEPGYFSGTVSLPVLAGSVNTFAVVAWATTGPYAESAYDFNPSTPVIQGASALWAETVPGPPGPPLSSPRGIAFTVQIVPEPSASALAGLGIVSLWVRRSRWSVS